MNIDCLRYFLEVAKAKNISVVAKNFHITGSALSQQLTKLEQNLNVKLLIRNNKGVTLTNEGELLLKYSETIISTYNKMIEDINSLNQQKNLVTIESVESLSTTILPNVISSIKSANPNYTVNLNTTNNFCTSNLLNNICDITITYKKANDNDEIISKKLGKDKILLVSDESYALNSITKKDFLYLPFILSVDKYCLAKDIEVSLINDVDSIDDLDIIYSTNSYFSAINGLKSSQAVTLLPQSIFNAYKNTHNLKAINVKDFNLDLEIYINYTKGFYKSNGTFIKLLTKIIKENL